jgi:hypothetical protein
MDASGTQVVASDAPSLQDIPAFSSSVAHSPLFKLPRELRDYIYEYSFCNLYTTYDDGSRAIEITKEAGIPEPALLVTSKILREEAAALFYGHTRLALAIDSYDPAVMLLWKQKSQHLTQSCGLTPARLFSYSHDGPREWDNLKLMLRLYLAEKVQALYAYPPSSPEYDAEERFIYGLFKAVRRMRCHPWQAVEPVLDMLRPGLIALHPEWRL